MTNQRELGNNAMWAFEHSYARFTEIEALLRIIVNSTSISPADRTRIQAARFAASRGRERIVEAHPKAPKKATKW